MNRLQGNRLEHQHDNQWQFHYTASVVQKLAMVIQKIANRVFAPMSLEACWPSVSKLAGRSPAPLRVQACRAWSWRAAAFSAGGDGGRRAPEYLADPMWPASAFFEGGRAGAGVAPISITGGMLADEAMSLFGK
jgi:hypothetical protein